MRQVQRHLLNQRGIRELSKILYLSLSQIYLLKGLLVKKYKVIIDTDPGVDDAACLIYALHDKQLDIKLLTTVVGNLPVEKCTRNLLHILDKFGLDYPVAEGASKAMNRVSPTAEHVHGVEGLGGYRVPKTIKHKLLEEDAVSAMYRVLSEGDGDIIPIVLGPHTNMGLLFERHPDIIKKIPKIIFMGGAPYGMKGYPLHISFNISSDPEAFKIVLDSKIPLVMVPSDMGRNKAHLEEEMVYKLRDMNEVGKMMFQMFDKYWEHGYPDKRIATNDTCAYYYLINSKQFKTLRVDLTVDTDKTPGKIIATPNRRGQVLMTTALNRKKFLKWFEKSLHEFDNLSFKKKRT